MISPAVAIIAELIRAKGTLVDAELYDNVKAAMKAFDAEITWREFNKLLMTLELRGYISVESAKKGYKIVHLRKTPAELQPRR